MQVELLPSDKVDTRAAPGRRLKATLSAWAAEFQATQMSEAQRILAQRCIVLLMQIEESETAYLNDGKKLPSNHVASVALVERLLSKLERQKSFGGLAAA